MQVEAGLQMIRMQSVEEELRVRERARVPGVAAPAERMFGLVQAILVAFSHWPASCSLLVCQPMSMTKTSSGVEFSWKPRMISSIS